MIPWDLKSVSKLAAGQNQDTVLDVVSLVSVQSFPSMIVSARALFPAPVY